MVTNVGGIAMNGSGASLSVTNATGQGNLYLGRAGALTIGGSNGWGGNTLILSNQIFATTVASTIGNGSSNNVLTLLTNVVWNAGAQAITVGSAAALSNQLTLNGGSVSNAGAVIVGSGAGANFNSLIITNGGQFVSAGASVIIGSGAANSSVTSKLRRAS